ncbi:MAG: helix-turn-helix domain-containing protein [Oscillospiraceae bacterium]|nr:helix-turn-helix domain-containing protein [Oscillospiraceae bacterium]
MDCNKIGALIRAMRREQALTQLQLAARLGVSDKAVSKWERGVGCPDVELLPLLSAELGVDLPTLLSGDARVNALTGGSMKKLNFYVCPLCGNLVMAAAAASVCCCGRPLAPLAAQRADDAHALTVEHIENEYFITAGHPMEKGHYLSFVALLTGESVLVRKLYPEWEVQTRLPRLGHGKLVWYCTQHGLFWQPI